MTARTAATVAGLLALLGVLVRPTPAGAQSAEPVDLGVYGQPVRFVGGGGVTFTVDGEDRYLDSVELRLVDGELTLVNELTMQGYVEGLGEMPASWPMEALKAQAVAARTYAWHQMQLGTFDSRGYDICATVACQVFKGREVVETPGVGQRWAQAVAETPGEVLLHDGEPILARYFSTSGGATRDNEDVFPSEGPRPYLKGVPDPHDEVSPLHRWQVTFTREELDAILAQGETLSAAVPLADITWIEASDGRADQVRVTGRDGTAAQVGASAFRFFVSDVAPQLFPDRFPSERPDGGRLPATLPSSRLRFEVTDTAVVVDGLGWGHGVGMGQYGAMGKAEAGMTYDDILAAYYGGLRPVTPAELPDRVRVGLQTGRDALELRADGPFRVQVGDTLITDRGLGSWRVMARPDRTVQLLAPPGYGAPLVVAPTETGRRQPVEVEVIQLETVTNKPTELRLEIRDAAGETVVARPLGVVDPGRQTVRWDLDDGDGQQVPAGTYEARLVATDEQATEAGTAVQVEVRGIPADGEPLEPVVSAARPLVERDDAVDPAAVALAALGGLVIGVAGGALVPRRRR